MKRRQSGMLVKRNLYCGRREEYPKENFNCNGPPLKKRPRGLGEEGEGGSGEVGWRIDLLEDTQKRELASRISTLAEP